MKLIIGDNYRVIENKSAKVPVLHVIIIIESYPLKTSQYHYLWYRQAVLYLAVRESKPPDDMTGTP